MPLLAHMYNYSILNWFINTSKFPDNFDARVTQIIPKAGDKCSESNYRPISVLPVFSNIFEDETYKPLYDYLKNNLIFAYKPVWLSW